MILQFLNTLDFDTLGLKKISTWKSDSPSWIRVQTIAFVAAVSSISNASPSDRNKLGAKTVALYCQVETIPHYELPFYYDSNVPRF